MKPGMKMMMMERMRQQPENNRSEYGGGKRRMIGYDRGEGGNANTSNYGGMEGRGESRNYGSGYGGGGSNYAENRMEYGGGSSNYGEGYGGGGSSNYGENRMEYGMESMENRRRRDSRGRFMESEGYQGNRGYGRNETESRRRRDSRGRYALNMGGEDEDEEEMSSQTWYPPYGAMTPQNMHGGYGDIYAKGSIYAPGAMNHPMYGGEMMAAPVDEHTARKWVQKMDGGQKFTPEQAEQMRNAHCPECERWEFYVAMNAMYSDYCETAKKMGMDKADFYALLAKDFLKDKDAKPNKLRRYMESVAK